MEHQVVPRRPCLDLAASGALLDAERSSPRVSRLAKVAEQTPGVDFAKDVGQAKPGSQPHHRRTACCPGNVPRSTLEE